jgi:DNA-binding GntR family transcriptional regulator
MEFAVLEELLKNHLSLTDKTIEIIEREILNGSIKPGERIIETQVAKILGISKSPVREALKRLEGDGIVELISRKGYIAKAINLKSIHDFFEIMLILEPMVAKFALRRKDEAVVQEIDQILRQMEKALSEENHNTYLALNETFHGLFYALNKNEWIIKIVRMLRKQARILRSLSLFTKDRFRSSIEEHFSIANAYKKGDARLLTKAVSHHVEMFKKNILESDFVRGETSPIGQKKFTEHS